MDYPGNGGLRYEVYCSGQVAKAIREAHQRASQEGRGPAMRKALRQAIQLRQNPKNFGEALYHLPILRMQIHTALLRPIAIDFAICTDRPLVFIKGVTLLSK